MLKSSRTTIHIRWESKRRKPIELEEDLKFIEKQMRIVENPHAEKLNLM